ncbi:MAG: peptidylprolyl isomerase [Candidatus Eisenbacteria bacterium]
MKRILLVLMVMWVTPLCAAPAGVPAASMVVEWEGGGISVGDFVAWWERIDPPDRPPLSTIEEKTAFLESMISASLMLAEAESLGLDHDPNVVDWIRSRRTSLLMDELMAQATAGRLGIDDEEVEHLYLRRLTQVVARHLITPTLDEAEAMIDSINSGVPFEDLAMRHSTCASAARGGALGAVRWGDFSDRWSEQAFRLEPGEISPPFKVETGYGIVKIQSKTLVEPPNPEAERQAIRNRLEKQLLFEEKKVFTDSLRLAYGFDIDEDAVIELCSRYAVKLMELGETREVVDIDVIPDLMDSEKARPVATYEGGSLSTGELVDIILGYPYAVRPELDNPNQMIPLVWRQARDTLLVMEAEKRELDKLPKIAVPLLKVRQRKLAAVLFRHLTQDAVVPEEELRAHYESDPEAQRFPRAHVASKILLSSREAADSLLELIEMGESFEELARENSLDPFSAPHGGDLGLVKEGKDEEFDGFFAQMEVGDIRYFRSLEGHLIMWLRERHESRIPTFEQVRHVLTTSMLPVYKDQMLMDWIAKKREELGLTINHSVLEQIKLGS